MNSRKFGKLYVSMMTASVCFLVSAQTGMCFMPLQSRQNKLFHQVRETARKAVTAGDVPSVSIAVAKDGEIIWVEAFGWADREKMVKATPHTVYPIASISKPFTATGLMTLVEKGLVDLDKPVNTYLGSVKVKAHQGSVSDATIRRLLNHTSGLPEHYSLYFENEPYPCPGSEETIRKYGFLYTPPGEIGQYSNLGFGIIGHIISRVSGLSYEQFMKKEVFLPLGLTRTSVSIDEGLEESAAATYDQFGNRLPVIYSDCPAAGAICSSVHDLVRFGMFHLKSQLPDQTPILSAETIDAMHTVWDPDALYRDDASGLGFSIDDDWNGYRAVYHAGGMPGAHCILMMVPSEHIAIAVLCNAQNIFPFEINEEILAVLLPKFRDDERHAEQGAERRTVDLADEFIGKWEGTIKTYDGELNVEMEFQNDGDIHIQLENQLKTLLTLQSYGNGYIFGTFNGTIPTSDNERCPYILQLFVRLREDRINGRVTAHASKDGYSLFNHSSWIELKR